MTIVCVVRALLFAILCSSMIPLRADAGPKGGCPNEEPAECKKREYGVKFKVPPSDICYCALLTKAGCILLCTGPAPESKFILAPPPPPPDPPLPNLVTAPEARCEKGASKSIAKLSGALTKCYDKAAGAVVAGKAPEPAMGECMARARQKYAEATAKLIATGGCPACMDLEHAGTQMETILTSDILVRAYCASLCGNGMIDAGEQCDDGNTDDGDGCDVACNVEVCGNGIVQADEECDDGGTVSGDGCSSTCTAEPYTCVGWPSAGVDCLARGTVRGDCANDRAARSDTDDDRRPSAQRPPGRRPRLVDHGLRAGRRQASGRMPRWHPAKSVRRARVRRGIQVSQLSNKRTVLLVPKE
jgi:cysteine-rich repeat protein